MNPPAHPKIYHIVHVDRLSSIITDDHLWCDAEAIGRASPGTTIGMNGIKQRRLNELTLSSHSGLYVGSCVPFYFCPRSVMLYLIAKGNDPDLSYRDGQGHIIHLEADLRKTVHWATQQPLRWAFTLGNAGSRYFEDRSDLSKLGEIDWSAVQARDWRNQKEAKQAEFLIEHRFPWSLVERIGVRSQTVAQKVHAALAQTTHRPPVHVFSDWYY